MQSGTTGKPLAGRYANTAAYAGWLKPGSWWSRGTPFGNLGFLLAGVTSLA